MLFWEGTPFTEPGKTRQKGVSARSMSNTFDKLSVLDSFIEEVNSYLPEIEANLERLAQSPGDMEALEETYRRTHTIGGSASMMDFPGLAHVAHGMEDILGDVLDGLASLDQPTVELLKRSLARLHRLVGGIQHGIDENAIVSEDDEDYARYRAQQDAAAQGVAGGMITPEYVQQESGQFPAVREQGTPAISSLDEMLASFRTPQPGSQDWPEEPVIRAEFPPRPEVQLPVPPMQPEQHAQFEAPAPAEATPFLPQPSALELLAGSPRQQELPSTPSVSSMVPPTPPLVPPTPRVQSPEAFSSSGAFSQAPAQETAPLSAFAALTSQQMQPLSQPLQMSPAAPSPSGPLPAQSVSDGQTRSGEVLPVPLKIYQDMQGEARALEDQAISLQRTLAQLRLAASVIEAQRAEFRGFLDGSRDALDRMEDWAGKAMGLNLRNSPEQVRRYLPLSVVSVANSKMKKVLELLNVGVSGAQMTDEQIQEIVQQLHNSLVSCGAAFQQLQAQANTTTPIFRQEPGWTPWEMQSAQEPNTVRERVTFERQGDIAALRAQIEAQLQGDIAILRTRLEQQIREELRQEYEARPLSLAARAELEQQIRNEVRQEYEARRQLQAQVSGSESSETLHELEARLRSEIEIQVRQEFLNQITELACSSAISGAPSLIPPPAATPRTSNYLDQAREATGLAPAGEAAPESRFPAGPHTAATSPAPTLSASVISVPQASAPPPVSAGIPSPAPASTAFSSDFVEEAAEIFRVEAEEHLQTISMYVAALEKDPTRSEEHT